MKWPFICLVLLIDVQAVFIIDSNKWALLSFFPQKRVAREIGGYLRQTAFVDNALKENCASYSSKLEDSKKEMQNCVSRKSIFHTPKGEYINNIKSCTNGTKEILKVCLPEKLRYLPEFIFELWMSFVEFLYDNHNDIKRWLVPCSTHLKSNNSEKRYNECALQSGGTSDKIPGSKETFCEKFVAISRCFVKQVNSTCIPSPKLEKLMEDYMDAMKKPCQ